MNSDKTVQGVLVGLIVFAAIFFVVERLLGRGRTQPVFRKGWLTDATYWFATILLTKPLARLMFLFPVAFLVLAQATSIDVLRMKAYTGYGPLSRQPDWLQAIQVYLLVDFIGYWVHRKFHGGRWWPFHAVHHSSEELDWLGSLRVHPINDLVNKLAQATPVLLLGYNPTATLSTAPILTFYAIFLHANVNWDFGPLRYVSLRRCSTAGITHASRKPGTRTSPGCFPFGIFCSAHTICQQAAGRKTSAFASRCPADTCDSSGRRSRLRRRERKVNPGETLEQATHTT